LQQAEKVVPVVTAMLSAARSKNKHETALAYLAELIQTGEVSLKDWMAHSQPDTLVLAKPIVFVDREESSVSPVQIEALPRSSGLLFVAQCGARLSRYVALQ